MYFIDLDDLAYRLSVRIGGVDDGDFRNLRSVNMLKRFLKRKGKKMFEIEGTKSGQKSWFERRE